MKNTNLNTHIGHIAIDKEVIATYAGAVATECAGIVGMAGVMKSGLVNLLKKDAVSRGINVTLTPAGKLSLDFHVIVAYGVNIPIVAANLTESVLYRVEEFTGLEVERINVYVESVRVIDE